MIAELFLEGQPLFELAQLLAYRRGQHDPSQHLEKVFPIASFYFIFSLWVSNLFPSHIFLSYKCYHIDSLDVHSFDLPFEPYIGLVISVVLSWIFSGWLFYLFFYLSLLVVLFLLDSDSWSRNSQNDSSYDSVRTRSTPICWKLPAKLCGSCFSKLLLTFFAHSLLLLESTSFRHEGSYRNFL